MLQYEELRLKLEALLPGIEDLAGSIGLDQLRREAEELDAQASAPGFWDDMEFAQKMTQKAAGVKGKIEAYEKLQNDYQDTLAQLQMQFAVELRPAYDEPDTTTTTTTTTRTTTATSTTTTRTTTKDSSSSSSKHTTHTSTTHREIVKTGDYTDTIPYIIAAGVSGLVFLLLAFYSLKERRKQKGGQA